MSEYIYSNDWFDISTQKKLSELLIFNDLELHFLEIGSYEGKSTIWFLENYLKNSQSTITCVDAWLNYSQTYDSLDSYNTSNAEWKFKDLNIKNNFLKNIILSGKSNQVKILQGYSHEILPSLLVNKMQYDLIFVDGNHTSLFVLTDIIFSWYLLKMKGIMVLDDYGWKNPSNTDLGWLLCPKIAIDNFLWHFQNYIEIISKGYQVIIRKIK